MSNWLVAIVGGAIATIVGGVVLFYILPSQQAADTASLTIAPDASSVTLRCERTADCVYCFQDVATFSIQRGWLTKPTITEHFGTGTIHFDIVQSSATHYRGESKGRGISVELDRVSGDLRRLVWGSAESVAILVDLYCARRITKEQCRERYDALRDTSRAGWLECTLYRSVPPRCQQWKDGSKLLLEQKYTCRATAHQF